MAGAGIVMAGGVLRSGLERPGRGLDAFGEVGATVILQAGSHALPREIAERFAGANASVMQLQPDPVRQWRGAQGPLLADRKTRLMGVTSWPQFLLVRGLAEESGRRVRYQRPVPADGGIIWFIA